ncbi:MAG: tetratricopeptide repeat protein [Gammaproteobacteria bacterium]|nr:tetratricopeptide repeat protein [Gammaproteobacteria bacterium]
MALNLKFWVPMAVFQIAFALTIFTITRQYYILDSENVNADSAEISQPAFVWPDGQTGTNSTQLNSSTFNQSAAEDPAEVTRQANEYFTNRQYDKAADLYERLLVFDPNNVETYNNLGITLHYLGKSGDAILRLKEGVAIDPTHQRIWLTLGFVNSQTGDIVQARTALNTAASINADNEIGKSAIKMLEKLP